MTYASDLISPVRFCTGRLYGTYSERRSTLTVTVSRWTFTFLMLHNLTVAGSFAATVCSKTLDEGWQMATQAHRILEEVVSVELLNESVVVLSCCSAPRPSC